MSPSYHLWGPRDLLLLVWTHLPESRMAGVPGALRTGSCLSQHVNLPYMQEGEQEMIVEGHLGGAQRRDRENTRGLGRL